jgi:type IV secretory pathway VirB10-like protein
MTREDPLLERYREANALDPARPSANVRENVLARSRAATLGEARPAAANDAFWRWRALGGLAVLGLAALVVLEFDRGTPEERDAVRAPAAPQTTAPAPVAPPASAAKPPRPSPPVAAKPAAPPASEARTRSAEADAPAQSQAQGAQAQGALAREIDVNAIDAQGRTALMRAALQGDTAGVRRLLEAGADPGQRDAQGRSAADLAREAGHDAVLLLLESATAAPPR